MHRDVCSVLISAVVCSVLFKLALLCSAVTNYVS